MTTTDSPISTVVEFRSEANPPSARAVAGTGAVAGIAASVAAVLVAGAAKAIDIPMQVASSAGEAAEDIPMTGFVSLILASTAIGIVLALALARYAKRPARTFVTASALLTVVSFAGPLTAHHATTATRAVLELTHVVAAAVIIPAVASRLPQRGARR